MNTKLNHLLFPIEIHIRSVKTNINTCILKYNVPHTLQVSIVNKISFQLHTKYPVSVWHRHILTRKQRCITLSKFCPSTLMFIFLKI